MQYALISYALQPILAQMRVRGAYEESKWPTPGRGDQRCAGRIVQLTLADSSRQVQLDYPQGSDTYMDPPALSRRLQVKTTRFGTDAAIYPASE